jgi:cysteine desulfurase
LESVINEKTLLVSLMHVNNEVGSINDIKSIGNLCRQNNVFFHVDAAQGIGKLPIDVKDCNIDLMSLNAHKIYGPKGIGALFINNE